MVSLLAVVLCFVTRLVGIHICIDAENGTVEAGQLGFGFAVQQSVVDTVCEIAETCRETNLNPESNAPITLGGIGLKRLQ